MPQSGGEGLECNSRTNDASVSHVSVTQLCQTPVERLWSNFSGIALVRLRQSSYPRHVKLGPLHLISPRGRLASRSLGCPFVRSCGHSSIRPSVHPYVQSTVKAPSVEDVLRVVSCGVPSVVRGGRGGTQARTFRLPGPLLLLPLPLNPLSTRVRYLSSTVRVLGIMAWP